MNRLARAIVTSLLAFAAACSSDKVKVTLFKAAPDAIELGQSTQLLFAVDPADAKVSIAGVGDATGKTSVTISPAATTTYQLTATKGSATASGSATVTVGPRKAVSLTVVAANATPVAGEAVAVTVSAVDSTGAAALGFGGTVHLTSSDPLAVLPADFSFTPSEPAVKQVSVTLTAAGVATLIATDISGVASRAAAAFSVKHGAATACVIAEQSAASVAGNALGVTVSFRDTFGNPATSYAGTVRLTSSDARAILPPDATFVPSTDAGTRAFAATLLTAGAQTVTVTDLANPALHCSAPVAVSHAAPQIVLSIPADANAGFGVPVGVVVKDVFDNAVTDYAGTVTFTSSDSGSGAAAPAALVFTGAEGGVGSTSATFVTPGAQTLTATDGGTPVATGFAHTAVHGLAYTAPTSGRVRLVANAAQSNSQVVQLDLVANERLVISTFFGGGPGSFAAGMNLPLDTTRVGADATLFTPGPALPAGTGTPAAVGRIGADHVLYTAVSRKRAAGTPVFSQVTEVQSGQVFYSVRLKLQQGATPGLVFDGAQPSPLYRASVRDQFGNDFLSQAEIGVGKLEVR